MIRAAIRLHQATLEARYLAQARAWTAILDKHYWRADIGGYSQSADDTEDVIVRLASGHDEATPNANGIMVSNLVWLGLLTGEDAYRARAEAILTAFSGDVAANLAGHTGLLAASIDLLAPQQVAIVGAAGPGGEALVAALHSVSLPGALEYVIEADTAVGLGPSLTGKSTIDGKAAAYVCLGPQCSMPVTDAGALKQQLAGTHGAIGWTEGPDFSQ
jgi:hypothetical protein